MTSPAPTGLWRAVRAIVWKDLTAERRSREMLTAMLVFALLVIFSFNFALDLNPKARSSVSSGVLWVTFIFAGTLGLNRSLASEKDHGGLDSLLLAPIERNAIYFGKAIANLLFMFFVEAVVLPLYALLYNVNLFSPGLLLIIGLGSVGYVAVGTLLSSMAVQTRTREMLLPILLFPLTLPVLIAAVKGSAGFLSGLPWADIRPWVNLLVVYDLMFIAVAFMVFDYIVEE